VTFPSVKVFQYFPRFFIFSSRLLLYHFSKLFGKEGRNTFFAGKKKNGTKVLSLKKKNFILLLIAQHFWKVSVISLLLIPLSTSESLVMGVRIFP
jgi:hypothetical protein